VFNPCTVSLSRRLPSAQELAGLSSNLFMEFFKDLLRGQTGTAQWTVTDSSANGVIIGSVHAPNQIHTEFVFENGKLTCCTIDHPYALVDINDAGLAIGYMPFDGRQNAFLTRAASGGPVRFHIGGYGQIPPFIFDPRVTPELRNSLIRLDAIANDGRVLGRLGATQQFVLTPEEIPEPESFALLATGLITFAWIYRKRRAATPVIKG
jgi:PEP-CTERM motif